MTALLLLTFACTPEPEPEPEPPVPMPELTVDLIELPSDPWSPVWVHFRSDALPSATMTVEGPSGPVDLDVTQEAGGLVGRPVGTFEPGPHVLTEASGITLSEPFEILPYGMDPDFPGLQVGDAFRLDAESGIFEQPVGIGALIQSQLVFTFVLEVTAVRDGEADFRVIVVEDERACSAHTATATVDSLGRLDWEDPFLEFPVLGTTTRLHDASLRLGILDDVIGGVRIAGVLDTAPLGPGIVPDGGDDAFCDLAEMLGVPCTVCPDTGLETCVGIVYSGGEGDAFEIPWLPGASMSACVVDPDAPLVDIPPFECEPVSCSTHGPAAAWGLLPLVLAVLRRRRSTMAPVR